MTKIPHQFLIEGVDRLGKSSLIQGLLDELGYHLVIHYQKPTKLKAYSTLSDPLFRYQWELYNQMFGMISQRTKVIFDRAHLGELVYAPMYRGYDPQLFIPAMEKSSRTKDARLILLTTSDFSFLEDDGLSIDFSKKEEEQARFIAAFEQSAMEDKVLIDVHNGLGGYKSREQILNEALKR